MQIILSYNILPQFWNNESLNQMYLSYLSQLIIHITNPHYTHTNFCDQMQSKLALEHQNFLLLPKFCRRTDKEGIWW